jgi:hypothetical protein
VPVHASSVAISDDLQGSVAMLRRVRAVIDALERDGVDAGRTALDQVYAGIEQASHPVGGRQRAPVDPSLPVSVVTDASGVGAVNMLPGLTVADDTTSRVLDMTTSDVSGPGVEFHHAAGW